VSFVQGSIQTVPVLADRPGLVFIVVFGLGVVLVAFAVFYFIRRMGK
jgi:hypothetical protein